MEIPPQFIYLIALIPYCLIWVLIFLARKDLRWEMLVMSIMIGFFSVATSYYWWTEDWWRPLTITGTKVGVEDFILGLSTGGIMATIYEVLFKRGLYKRKLHHHISGGLTILFLLSQTTMWLFYAVGLTSFWASFISMLLVVVVMISIRKDLMACSLLSGILVMAVSIPSYFFIVMISPQWIENTYIWEGLSDNKVAGIPIEEFVFWFMSGLVFGPFYEYWQGEKLKVLKN